MGWGRATIADMSAADVPPQTTDQPASPPNGTAGTAARAAAPVTAGAATLAEIARAAGVSAPTVSKVLNGRGDVAPATRSRVEELLRLHGYQRRRGNAQ